MGRLNTIVTEACEGLKEVDGDLIQRETLKNLYDGVALSDVNTALVMTARTLVEREPNYSFVTARLLMDTLRAEGLNFLNVAESATHHEMADLYAKALPAYIAKGIEFGLLNPVLAGAAMALSSVSVVSNALLLKTWKPKDLEDHRP